jgi:hypothetical protein
MLRQKKACKRVVMSMIFMMTIFVLAGCATIRGNRRVAKEIIRSQRNLSVYPGWLETKFFDIVVLNIRADIYIIALKRLFFVAIHTAGNGLDMEQWIACRNA